MKHVCLYVCLCVCLWFAIGCHRGEPESRLPVRSRPNDGHSVHGNSDAVVSQIHVVPSPAFETSILKAFDQYGRLAQSCLWHVDDQPVLGVTTPTLTGWYFAKGNQVRCNDSPAVLVQNAPPRIQGLHVVRAWRDGNEGVSVWLESVEDDDGDPVRLLVAWFVHGVRYDVQEPFLPFDVIPTGALVWVTVTPFDGEDIGQPVTAPVAPWALQVWEPGALPVQILSFGAQPPLIEVGAPVRVTWVTRNAARCVLVPGGELLPDELTLGQRDIVLLASQALALECRGVGGPVTATTAVMVTSATAHIRWFNAEPAIADYGGMITFSWNAQHAFECNLNGSTSMPPVGRNEQNVWEAGQHRLTCFGVRGAVTATTSVRVRAPVIHEIAWMGTLGNDNAEWIELFNPATIPIRLDGWRLAASDGSPVIDLRGQLPAGGYWLLERTADTTVPEVSADQIYTGSLANTGDELRLLDPAGRVIDVTPSVWVAGSNAAKATMERNVALLPGGLHLNWSTASVTYTVGWGTPRAANSKAGYPQGGTGDALIRLMLAEHATAQPGYRGVGRLRSGLLEALQAATQSIDFSFYGVQGMPEVALAMRQAEARGVRVRGIVDGMGERATYESEARLRARFGGDIRVESLPALMHNKYVVIDGKVVWAGSANVFESDLYSEMNCNAAVRIENASVAQAFTRDFEQLFAGTSGVFKRPSLTTLHPRFPDGTWVETYFGPQDSPVQPILRAIALAQATIDATIYYFTRADVATALVEAAQRGVRVRLLIDALGARDLASQHRALRRAGVAVKTENWPGKAHAKMLVADGYRVVLGSMNWTQQGAGNDEFVLLIENTSLGRALTAHFEADWAAIPITWATRDPLPEGSDSPGSLADGFDNDEDGLTDPASAMQPIQSSQGEGTIQVYFNKGVYAVSGEPMANGNVRLDTALIARLAAATTLVDVALYDLNLPEVTNALMAAAERGVRVRMIADAKDPYANDFEGVSRDKAMRLQLERLIRGADGVTGTRDDTRVLGDGPIFAVTDIDLRRSAGLPTSPADLVYTVVQAGEKQRAGYLLAYGERKTDGTYYSGDEQMHNKFAVVDGHWVWTGSWNPTQTSVYGDESQLPRLAGNTDVALEIDSASLARIFTLEFELMWGTETAQPDPSRARFHRRKLGLRRWFVDVGGRVVEVIFSPGGQALARLCELIEGAQTSAHFLIYAWSHEALMMAAKRRWEGTDSDGEGETTGFRFDGVFDAGAWDAWWSASLPMGGLIVPGRTPTRWAALPPVYPGREDRKLHTKILVIDPDTPHAVSAVGSVNWSQNGDAVNDENLLVIWGQDIARQFMQFHRRRLLQAGGRLD